jgi:sulfite exporter TauE/SafE
MFLTAFLLGLVGSLHCIGMCGPLTLLLPNNDSGALKYTLGRISYNLGRVLTYSFLGAAAGFFGEKISFFIGQKTLSIGIGVLMVSYVFFPLLFKGKTYSPSFLYKFSNLLKNIFASLFKTKRLYAQFAFGLVNGLLPCGMVYAALAGAFLATNWADASLSMLFFGLGTIPLMLPISMSAHYIRLWAGARFKTILSFSYVLLGVWLIFRGLDYHIKTLYTAPNQDIKTVCASGAHK